MQGGGHAEAGRPLGLFIYHRERCSTEGLAVYEALTLSGFGSVSAAKEAVKVGFDYYKANATGVSASVKAGDHNYHIHIVELHNTGPTKAMTLTAFVALSSAVLGKSVQSQLVVLGSMSLGGSIVPVQNLA